MAEPEDPFHASLPKREAELLRHVLRRGRATASELHKDMATERSYSTVRSQLTSLEEKGYLRHEVEGRQFVYMPAFDREIAQKSALRRMVRELFKSSPAAAVASLLSDDDLDASPEELDRIIELARKAKKRGR